MNDRERQDLIEQYLDGTLDDNSRQRFEERLRDEPSLAEALAEERAARALVVAAGRAELRARLDRLESQSSARRPWRLHRRYLWGAAAAVVALAVAVLCLWPANSAEPGAELFADHFSAYRPPAVERGQGGLGAWEQAIAAYQAEEFARAAVLFERSLADSTNLPYLCHFYQGVSLLGQSPPRPRAALAAFDRMRPFQHDYGPQVHWYRGLAYLRLEDYAAARTAFAELASSSPFHREAADALLRRLDQQLGR